jgi:VWFA-related protein
MFIGARLNGLLLFLSLFTAVASAQRVVPGAQSGATPLLLDVVVADKSGQAVTDLQQQDFTLFDNKAKQTITSFTEVNGREAPVEAVIVIDAVNAPYQNIGYERIQIDKFLHDEEGNLAYPLALAVLTDRGAQVIGGFSSNGAELSASLAKADIGLRNMGVSAGYYGAEERLQLSLASLNQLVTSLARRPGRKILIWVSPGWPLLSGPNTQLDAKQQREVFRDIVNFSTQLRLAGVTLYSIDPVGPSGSTTPDWSYEYFLKGVSKPGQVQLGNLALPVIAVQSGGIAFSFTNGIAERLHKCFADAAPYYEISFVPAPAQKQDEYHQLQVKVAKSGLVARTREGYYAQP